MAENKQILVTGGAGYIGSHTVVELINSGYEPIIVDDFSNAHESVLDGVEGITGRRPEVFKVDICDYEGAKAIFENHKFYGVIHFAAYKAVGESVEFPLKYYKNNVQGLANCLELALEFGVKNFVFSSSCTVYGEPEGSKVVDENTPTMPANSPYGFTKQIGEQMIRDVINSGADIRVMNLRYFNPVGAHESSKIGEYPLGRPNNLFPVVTQTAVGKLPGIKVFGNDYDTKDGTCLRDYIHVVDLADAHVKSIEWLAQQDESKVEILNIGTGEGTSVLEIIHNFEQISGVSLNWEFAPRRAGDVVEIYADVAKIKRVLGWQCKRNFKDALKDAWNWEQKLRNV